MSNSSLVTYTKLSPNCNKPRNHVIDTITIHCFVGQVTAESGCNAKKFVNYNAVSGASCNYVVGYDGSIGLCVDEANRSWCSSNRTNDHRAITIEVASETKAPYKATDKAYDALIKLVADICKRNGIKKLVWSVNKKDRVNHVDGCNMTVHRDFANKSCPGDYLYNKHGEIAEKVNALLGVKAPAATSAFTVGEKVMLKAGAKYTSGKSIPSWVFKSVLYVRQVQSNGNVVISTKASGAVTGTVAASNLEKVSATSKEYKVKVTASTLNVRAGVGTSNKVVATLKKNAKVTVLEEKDGWGRIKEKSGWISLTYTKKV